MERVHTSLSHFGLLTKKRPFITQYMRCFSHRLWLYAPLKIGKIDACGHRNIHSTSSTSSWQKLGQSRLSLKLIDALTFVEANKEGSQYYTAVSTNL